MYCWSYSKQWSEYQQKTSIPTNIKGPLFISIGTPAKLNTFLELNPHVPRDSIFVDDYNHELYKQLGFSRFDELNKDDTNKINRTKLTSFFDLGIPSLFNYATRFWDMVPTEGSVDWNNLPEGGLRNGGTLIVKGGEVIYQHQDLIPSDVPNVADVVDIAKKAANKNEDVKK